MVKIDIPMPKSCSDCPLKTVEEDYVGDYFYWCTPIKEALYGKKYSKQRFRNCPLKEIEENVNETM